AEAAGPDGAHPVSPDISNTVVTASSTARITLPPWTGFKLRQNPEGTPVFLSHLYTCRTLKYHTGTKHSANSPQFFEGHPCADGQYTRFCSI
ncbi:MAG: hypothetical protein KAQ74_06970, partial [Dehalococcoidia bacterium]|nr:hypothetical protein [Dehalococcoidia bacterium]